jgi:predicted glycosyltransferase
MTNLDRYLNQRRDLLQYAQLLLIPHDAGTYELPPDLSKKARFVGRVARPAGPSKRTEGNPDKPRIVITGGGGGYPGTVNFYNLATQAVSVLRTQFPCVRGHLIAGPLFGDWPRLQHESGIAVVPFEPDTHGTFATADLVIAQAGYNTVAELAEVSAKSVLVPAPRQWDDQCARADKTARANSNFRIYRGSEPAELAQLLAELLQTPTLPLRQTKIDGAHRAATTIYSLLGKSLTYRC